MKPIAISKEDNKNIYIGVLTGIILAVFALLGISAGNIFWWLIENTWFINNTSAWYIENAKNILFGSVYIIGFMFLSVFSIYFFLKQIEKNQ